MPTIRTELYKKVRSAILQYAFFRWESAVVVAGTILLTVFVPHPLPWWPWWGWPLLGLLGLLALVLSSLTDAGVNARVVQDLWRRHFDLDRIEGAALREAVERALEYQRRIEALVREQRDGALRVRLEGTADQLSEWIGNVYGLAVRLDAYRRDNLLARELKAVPQEVETLTARRRREKDPDVQRELDQVLESKGRHLETLRSLDTRMKQAELQLEQSLTALATIYSQVQLVDAQEVESGRSERLQADIREQVERLNDLVSSISQVYNHDAQTLA